MNLVYHLQATSDEIGEYVFLAGDPGRIPVIAEFFDDAHQVSSSRGFNIYSGFLEGAPVSAVSTGIGGPSTAIALEELIALGAHTFLRIGTCGSLQPHVKHGDAVISMAAIRDEGTTQQYVPIEYPAVANVELVSQLIAASQEAGITFHAGITHCKDSFFSEIPEYTAHPSLTELRWATWQRAQAVATEMEAAVLFILSSLRSCRAAALLSVVGSTMEGEPITDTGGVQKVVEIGIEAMRRMIQHDKQKE